jgi:hypothetical protein
MGESDFSGPFIVGFGLRPSRRGPCKTPQGQSRDIPVPEQGASAHARVYDDAEPTYVSRPRHGPYCLLQDGKHRRSEVGFRRSMAGLRYPLSTLRFAPHGSPRMTRGRCGSLRLHRRGLSPHTSCRSPGAPVHPNIHERRRSTKSKLPWHLGRGPMVAVSDQFAFDLSLPRSGDLQSCRGNAPQSASARPRHKEADPRRRLTQGSAEPIRSGTSKREVEAQMFDWLACRTKAVYS